MFIKVSHRPNRRVLIALVVLVVIYYTLLAEIISSLLFQPPTILLKVNQKYESRSESLINYLQYDTVDPSLSSANLNYFKKFGQDFEPKANRRFVIISVSVDQYKDFYYFNLPITVLAWRKIGIEPLVIVVKTSGQEINPLARKSIEYLELFRIQLLVIDSEPGYEMTTSMLIRLFVGLVPDHLIRDDDLIISSDTDLIPVNRNYFKVDTRKLTHPSVVIWNAFCCRDEFVYQSQK